MWSNLEKAGGKIIDDGLALLRAVIEIGIRILNVAGHSPGSADGHLCPVDEGLCRPHPGQTGIEHVAHSLGVASNGIILLDGKQSWITTEDEWLSRGPNQAPPENIIDPHEKTKAVRSQIIVGANIYGVAGAKSGHRPKGVRADRCQHCTARMRQTICTQKHR